MSSSFSTYSFTVNYALEMWNYMLLQMEKVTNFLHDKEKLKKISTLVVAGRGPTGEEISGMLAEMQHSIFIKDYPEFRKEKNRK